MTENNDFNLKLPVAKIVKSGEHFSIKLTDSPQLPQQIKWQVGIYPKTRNAKPVPQDFITCDQELVLHVDLPEGTEGIYEVKIRIEEPVQKQGSFKLKISKPLPQSQSNSENTGSSENTDDYPKISSQKIINFNSQVVSDTGDKQSQDAVENLNNIESKENLDEQDEDSEDSGDNWSFFSEQVEKKDEGKSSQNQFEANSAKDKQVKSNEQKSSKPEKQNGKGDSVVFQADKEKQGRPSIYQIKLVDPNGNFVPDKNYYLNPHTTFLVGKYSNSRSIFPDLDLRPYLQTKEQKSLISRRQVEIFIRDGQVFCRNLGKNEIKLGEKLVKTEELVSWQPGQVLALPGKFTIILED